jgi:hypothetical protein
MRCSLLGQFAADDLASGRMAHAREYIMRRNYSAARISLLVGGSACGECKKICVATSVHKEQDCAPAVFVTRALALAAAETLLSALVKRALQVI